MDVNRAEREFTEKTKGAWSVGGKKGFYVYTRRLLNQHDESGCVTSQKKVHADA